MLRKIVALTGAVLWLLAVSVMPARAWATAQITVTATCGCTYAVYVTGMTTANASVIVNYQFDVTEKNIPYHITGSVTTTADASGNFSEEIEGIQLPNACKDTVSFSNGTATVTTNGTVETGFTINLPDTLFCSGTPPPSGKALEIGPSSMEGHLQIRPGDWISGGYSFKFVNAGHGDTTVTVSSMLRMPFTCPQGGGSGGEIVINLGTHSYFVPAGNTDWQPTGDANSVLSWAGSGQAPDGCSGNIMDNSKGAIWDATISQNPNTGQLLNWRFKYRDPNAKGKGNVNCLDTTDPRRNKADVCGASWSQTVTDP